MKPPAYFAGGYLSYKFYARMMPKFGRLVIAVFFKEKYVATLTLTLFNKFDLFSMSSNSM